MAARHDDGAETIGLRDTVARTAGEVAQRLLRSFRLAALLETLPLGIAAGLVLGEQVGVPGDTWLLVRAGAE